MKHYKLLSWFFCCLLFFSCPKDDSPLEEEQIIQPVTVKLLSFEFIQQTDTNEDSLSFEVEFTNTNDFDVNGLPQITVTIGGGSTATSAYNQQCRTIPAKSSCVLSYSVVDDNPLLFPTEPIEFVSAEYIILD